MVFTWFLGTFLSMEMVLIVNKTRQWFFIRNYFPTSNFGLVRSVFYNKLLVFFSFEEAFRYFVFFLFKKSLYYKQWFEQ